ncbi:MAG TPA: hypothetical protein VFF15_00480 [Flavobacteriaceae bacterium]|nr:hypothetical protein [Flavobacteriaceae bacterium]
MDRIDINDPNLTLDLKPTNWGGGISLYNGIPFTGIIEEYFNGTSQLLSEGEYRDGVIHGRQVEYFLNGQIETEYYEKYGGFYGAKKYWNEQGALIYHEEFSDEGVSLWAKKYDDQGNLTDHWIGQNKVL